MDNTVVTNYPWLKKPWDQWIENRHNNLLHHAYIISGVDGLGQQALVDSLSSSLLCRHNQQNNIIGLACGSCKSCLLLAAGTHPDKLHITFEIADTGKQKTQIVVEQIRHIFEFVFSTAQLNKNKCIIIDPATAMNRNASNALLKSLEEPPANTFFFLIANKMGRLLPTIRSRCQMLPLQLPSKNDALHWLNVHGVTEEGERYLELANGGPLQAQHLFQQSSKAVEVTLQCIEDLLENHTMPNVLVKMLSDVLDDKKDRNKERASYLVVFTVLQWWLGKTLNGRLLIEAQKSATCFNLMNDYLNQKGDKALFLMQEDLTLARKKLESTANPDVKLLLEQLFYQWRKHLSC